MAIYTNKNTEFFAKIDIPSIEIEFINSYNFCDKYDLYIMEDHQNLREELLKFCKKHPTVIITSTDDSNIFRNYYEHNALDVSSLPISLNLLQVRCEYFLRRISKNFTIYEKRDIELIEQGFTGKQIQILRALESCGTEGIDRKLLTEMVWPKHVVVTKVLDVHISALRKKLFRIGKELIYSKDKKWILSDLTNPSTTLRG